MSPTYEYRCEFCATTFDYFLTMKEYKNERACPYCGLDSKHIISSPGFILKGSGFYQNDYKNKNKDKRTKKK